MGEIYSKNGDGSGANGPPGTNPTGAPPNGSNPSGTSTQGLQLESTPGAPTVAGGGGHLGLVRPGTQLGVDHRRPDSGTQPQSRDFGRGSVYPHGYDVAATDPYHHHRAQQAVSSHHHSASASSTSRGPPAQPQGQHQRPHQRVQSSLGQGTSQGSSASQAPPPPQHRAAHQQPQHQQHGLHPAHPRRLQLIPSQSKRPRLNQGWPGYDTAGAGGVPMGTGSSGMSGMVGQRSGLDMRSSEMSGQPMRMDSRHSREPAYHPQVEAISPAPEEARIDSNLMREKEEIGRQLPELEAHINNQEQQLRKLKERKQQLDMRQPGAGGPASTPGLVDGKFEMERSYENPIQAVIAECRRKANIQHHIFDRLCGTQVSSGPRALPLYRQPSDLPSLVALQRNFRQEFKPKLMGYIRRRKMAERARVDFLAKQYEDYSKSWCKKLDKVNNSAKRRQKEARMRECFEKVFPELKKNREDRERAACGANGGLSDVETSSVSQPSLVPEDGMMDCYSPVTDPAEELRKMKMEAIDPPLTLPPWDRKYTYIDYTGYVKDPKSMHQAAQDYNSRWNPEERAIFKEKFIQYPKNFTVISSYLEKKSTEECIQFYYLTKKQECYKQLVKKHARRRRAQAERQQQQQAQAQSRADAAEAEIQQATDSVADSATEAELSAAFAGRRRSAAQVAAAAQSEERAAEEMAGQEGGSVSESDGAPSMHDTQVKKEPETAPPARPHSGTLKREHSIDTRPQSVGAPSLSIRGTVVSEPRAKVLRTDQGRVEEVKDLSRPSSGSMQSQKGGGSVPDELGAGGTRIKDLISIAIETNLAKTWTGEGSQGSSAGREAIQSAVTPPSHDAPTIRHSPVEYGQWRPPTGGSGQGLPQAKSPRSAVRSPYAGDPTGRYPSNVSGPIPVQSRLSKPEPISPQPMRAHPSAPQLAGIRAGQVPMPLGWARPDAGAVAAIGGIDPAAYPLITHPRFRHSAFVGAGQVAPGMVNVVGSPFGQLVSAPGVLAPSQQPPQGSQATGGGDHAAFNKAILLGDFYTAQQMPRGTGVPPGTVAGGPTPPQLGIELSKLYRGALDPSLLPQVQGQMPGQGHVLQQGLALPPHSMSVSSLPSHTSSEGEGMWPMTMAQSMDTSAAHSAIAVSTSGAVLSRDEGEVAKFVANAQRLYREEVEAYTFRDRSDSERTRTSSEASQFYAEARRAKKRVAAREEGAHARVEMPPPQSTQKPLSAFTLAPGIGPVGSSPATLAGGGVFRKRGGPESVSGVRPPRPEEMPNIATTTSAPPLTAASVLHSLGGSASGAAARRPTGGKPDSSLTAVIDAIIVNQISQTPESDDSSRTAPSVTKVSPSQETKKILGAPGGSLVQTSPGTPVSSGMACAAGKVTLGDHINKVITEDYTPAPSALRLQGSASQSVPDKVPVSEDGPASMISQKHKMLTQALVQPLAESSASSAGAKTTEAGEVRPRSISETSSSGRRETTQGDEGAETAPAKTPTPPSSIGALDKGDTRSPRIRGEEGSRPEPASSGSGLTLGDFVTNSLSKYLRHPAPTEAPPSSTVVEKSPTLPAPISVITQETPITGSATSPLVVTRPRSAASSSPPETSRGGPPLARHKSSSPTAGATSTLSPSCIPLKKRARTGDSVGVTPTLSPAVIPAPVTSRDASPAHSSPGGLQIDLGATRGSAPAPVDEEVETGAAEMKTEVDDKQ